MVVRREARPAGRGGGRSTRTRILEVAADLFVRNGFEGTSVRAIARACSLTDPAVRYHFPSKRAILDELIAGSAPIPLLADRPGAGRDLLIDYGMAALREWLAVPGRLRLSAQRAFSRDPAADTLVRSNRGLFEAPLDAALHALYGDDGAPVMFAYSNVLRGILFHALIQIWEDFDAITRSAEYEHRVREGLGLALPPPVELAARLGRLDLSACGRLARPAEPAGFPATSAHVPGCLTCAGILDAATGLFVCQGFDATSIKEIAARCGISDAAIYHHFDSKEALLNNAFVRTARPPWRGATGAGSPLAERLVGMFDRFLAGAAASADAVVLLARHGLAGDLRARQLRTDGAALWFGEMRTLLLADFPTETADQVASALSAFSAGVLHCAMLEQPEDCRTLLCDEAFVRRVRAAVLVLLPLSPAECA